MYFKIYGWYISSYQDVNYKKKKDTRTSTALRDDSGVVKSPEIPSLSNGMDAASPPLVVVGGIAFIGKREAFLGS